MPLRQEFYDQNSSPFYSTTKGHCTSLPDLLVIALLMDSSNSIKVQKWVPLFGSGQVHPDAKMILTNKKQEPLSSGSHIVLLYRLAPTMRTTPTSHLHARPPYFKPFSCPVKSNQWTEVDWKQMVSLITTKRTQ